MIETMAELKTFDWGGNREGLEPIVEAIRQAHGDPAAMGGIEAELLDVLAGDAPRPAREFACRQLAVMGSDRALPVLGKLLMVEDTADMARFALERIPGDAASGVLREALTKTDGTQRIGIVNSLGQRRDRRAIGALAALLGGPDETLIEAAAAALGRIAEAEARRALAAARDTVPTSCRATVLDATLLCADALEAEGKTGEALAIYKELDAPTMPGPIRLAAQQGALRANGGKTKS